MIQHEMDHLDGVLILDRTSARPAQAGDARAARDAAGAARRRGLSPPLRTVYLGTSAFAAAVLERLAASAAPARARRHAAGPPARPRARAPAPAGRRRRARARHRADPARGSCTTPEVLERIAAAEPDALVVCAYGVLVREPLLTRLRDPQRPPVAAAALARRRAGRAGDHGRRRGDRRLDHAAHRGAGLGPGVPAGARADRGPTTTTARSAARLQALGGDLLVRALDERPPLVEQDEAGVTYAEKIEAADRALDPTRTPAEVERDGARAAPAHRRAAPAARRRLPRRASRARRPPGPTLAPGRRPRARGRRAAAARLPRRRARADRDPAAGRARRCRPRSGCAAGPTRR